MKLIVRLPICLPPAVINESIRSHLKKSLITLPNNLPEYDEGQLLDDLCFLLQSTHFLYTIQSRLRKERDLAGSQARALRSNPLPEEPKETIDVELDVSALHIRIIWVHGSWATQLLHYEALLLEGRQINVQQRQGFEKSFEWFCAEARFLWFQFKAQEDAAAAQGAGTAQLSETKQTKVVILNIHVRFVDGRPILACSKLQD